MEIKRLIESICDSAKQDIKDFKEVRLRNGAYGFRVTMNRLLTDEEKAAMNNKHCIGLDGVGAYMSDPEKRFSYFYVV